MVKNILGLTAGPLFSAITLPLNLRFSPPFYIDFKGMVKLKSSGEYGSSTIKIRTTEYDDGNIILLFYFNVVSLIKTIL